MADIMYSVGYHTDRGTTHPVNQDSFMAKRIRSGNTSVLIVGLFDGMGGGQSGELASGAVAKQIVKWATEHESLFFSGSVEKIRESLISQLEESNRIVRSYAQKNGLEMGTTAVLLILGPERYIVCNVGDSRAYRITRTETLQISEDHSLVNRLYEAGLIKKSEINSYSQKNVLLQAIGTLEKITPSFCTGEYTAEDQFLLCSDGLYHQLSEQELQGFYTESRERNALQHLLRGATENVIARGETDNITGILIKTYK